MPDALLAITVSESARAESMQLAGRATGGAVVTLTVPAHHANDTTRTIGRVVRTEVIGEQTRTFKARCSSCAEQRELGRDGGIRHGLWLGRKADV